MTAGRAIASVKGASILWRSGWSGLSNPIKGSREGETENLMNTQLSGSVKMAGEAGRGVDVLIELEEEQLTLAASGGGVIGRWSLSEVGVSSRPDGFHLRLEGEDIVLTTDDDARFALAIGMNAPTNRLARQMAMLRDLEAKPEKVVDLTTADLPLPPTDPRPEAPSRRSHRLSAGLPYLGPLVVVAATFGFIAAIVALASGSAITFPAGIPAWPAMAASSLVLAAGGFAAYQNPDQGRLSIAGGIALALVTILLTAGRLVDEGLAGEALFAFTTTTVIAGVLLAADTAGRHTLD
ncbi:hypothetical protein BH23ACT5_BH23ACT5_14320 [soil metagenome]